MNLYAETIRNGHPHLAPGPALESHYLLRAAVPGWAEHMAEWDQAGKAMLEDFEVIRDIPYGDTPEQKLDVVLPAQRSQNMPVAFLIHGGYWRALDKDSILFAARPPAQNGIVTVNIDYALCPGVTLTQLAAQCHQAMRWVRANIAAYGGDPGNLHCAGHSAGAQLSTLLALSPEFCSPIRSVTAVSGVYDLAPVAQASMQADLRLTEAEIRTLSPLRLPPPAAGRWLFAFGTQETPSFIWQTERYAAHAAGAKNRLLPIPGANHYTAISALAAGAALQQAWIQQIKEASP